MNVVPFLKYISQVGVMRNGFRVQLYGCLSGSSPALTTIWWLSPNGRAEVCGASCESSILSNHTNIKLGGC